MEEVGQGHSGEGCEYVRAVQSIVDALGAPPLGCDCKCERNVSMAWSVWHLNQRVAWNPGIDRPRELTNLDSEQPAHNDVWEMCCYP